MQKYDKSKYLSNKGRGTQVHFLEIFLKFD